MIIQLRLAGGTLPRGLTRGGLTLSTQATRGFVSLIVGSSTHSPSKSSLSSPATPTQILSNKHTSCRTSGLLTHFLMRRALMASSPFSTSSRLWSDKPPTNEIVPPPGTAKAGKAYPERLIIYHAGTGRITFLACLKLTTLFVFGFFGLIAVPSSITAGEPLYWTASLLACGIIPVVYVAYFTSPFVAHIHLHLPPFARWSRPILEKFVKTAPPNTKIDITTMSLIGKPRVSSMMLSDIKPAKSRLGLVNYARDTTLADKGRKWWRFKAVGEFSIQETHVDLKKIKTGWAWKELAEQIHKKAAGAVGQK